MIGDALNIMKGKEMPIRSSMSFYGLGKEHIIKDKKARKVLEKKTGRLYFENFRDFTDFAYKKLMKEYDRGFKK